MMLAKVLVLLLPEGITSEFNISSIEFIGFDLTVKEREQMSVREGSGV